MDVTVSADSTALPQGTDTGQSIIFAHDGRHRYEQTLDVTLDVGPNQSETKVLK